jgi:hypothetical protein
MEWGYARTPLDRILVSRKHPRRESKVMRRGIRGMGIVIAPAPHTGCGPGAHDGNGEAVMLDYAAHTGRELDAQGQITRVSQQLPRGMRLSARLRACVMADAFPLHSAILPP